MFPVFLDLWDRVCVVVGGGSVGRRKASRLLKSGAAVRLVCLETRPPGEKFAKVEWLTEPFRAEHLTGATLVFAAASFEVNRRVVSEAKERGLWVNAADDPKTGDFHVAAQVRRGALIVAISTGGTAPALAYG